MIINEDIYKELVEERIKQHLQWGEQNHGPLFWNAILQEEVGEVARAVVDNHNEGLSLEVYRNELVQVAAVAISAIESYDRNEGSKE